MGYKFGSAPVQKVLTLEKFRGVDYQSNPVTMDIAHSPSAPNMMISQTGYPEKRTGYRRMASFGKRINGVHVLKVGETIKMLVHAGNELYEYSGEEKSLIFSDMNDERSMAFQKDKVLYILDGKAYKCYGYDGEFAVKLVSEVAKEVTTSIGRKPSGGGASFDAVNLIGRKRINEFLADASSREYVLDSKEIEAVTKVEKMSSANGDWTEVPSSDFSVDLSEGKVTFVSPIGASPAGARDNLRIYFEKRNVEYEEKINQCRFFDLFTIGAGEYFFFAGNKDLIHVDFRSQVNDPTYFPDLNYSNIGQDNTAIMGYIKLHGNQVIIKEQNHQDVSIFVRSAKEELDRNGNKQISFPIVQGITGTGAVSPFCFVQLRDDNLYLADDGITSVQTTIISSTMTQNRSYFVNPHLLKQDLKNAVAIEFESRLYLAASGNVYIADSRQKKYEQNSFAESYQYEFCHWTSIPVRVWFKAADRLCFGDDLGNLFAFSKSSDELLLSDKYLDDGVPFVAYWDTPFMDFGTLSHNKTLKNLFMVFEPNVRTSCEVFFRVPDKPIVSVIKFADLFDWEDIDFERFSFVSDSAPSVIPTHRKIKRFILLQFRFQNDKAEPFGIYKVQANFTVNGKYKG